MCSIMLAFLTGCSYFDEKYDSGDNESSNAVGQEELTFPEGYTGGSVYAYPKSNEIYWFETMAEALDTIERLELNGSAVEEVGVFNCTEEYFDVKVQLLINRGTAEPVEEGSSPFDRKANVEVKWFAFNEYISIEELVYTYAEDICCLSSGNNNMFSDRSEKQIINSCDLTIDFGVKEYGLDWPDNVAHPNYYTVYYRGERISNFEINAPEDILPKDIIIELLDTYMIVGNFMPVYTQSFEEAHINCDYYWVETYEELEEALCVLKSYGNTINKEIAFDCEGLSFGDSIIDCKYLIVLTKTSETPIGNEENFLKRKFKKVSVKWLAFDRFTPIHYPHHEYTYLYAGAIFDTGSIYRFKYSDKETNIDLLDVGYWRCGDLSWSSNLAPGYYVVFYGEEELCHLDVSKNRFPTYEDYPPDEFIYELIKTIKFIE